MGLILARAYVASRALDFALSPPNGAAGLPSFAAGRVCVTGHSRNGKQSLLFAAFDERVGAVVGSSPGAPISSPYAYSSHNYYGEGPDAGTAGTWWLSSITQYTDDPGRMPMDGHGVLAMIAPRYCAIADAWTDFEGDSTFADEMGVQAASEVYRLLKAPSTALQLLHRPGGHHGFDSVASYLDWFDHVLGRACSAPAFPLAYADSEPAFQRLVYLTPAGFKWVAWRDAFAAPPPPPPPSAPLGERVSWLLQLDATPTAVSAGAIYAEESLSGRLSWPSVMLGHVPADTSRVQRQPLSFGDYVTATAYWPAGRGRAGGGGALLAVVWLHPYSYASGFSPSYGMARIPRSGVHGTDLPIRRALEIIRDYSGLPEITNLPIRRALERTRTQLSLTGTRSPCACVVVCMHCTIPYSRP